MFTWLTEDFLQAIAPRLVAALVALGIAHSSLLHSWGVSVDWSTLGGKITDATALLIGLTAAHHVHQAVTGGGK